MIEPTTRSDPPHSPSRLRRRLRRGLLLLIGSLTIIGPWPIDDAIDAPTRRTIDRLASSNVELSQGPIRVGLAEVDLTPDSPRPLAGFIGQIRTPFSGIDTPCYARALTVESASGSVTILTADLLLINARMAEAVVEQAGLRPDQVYFTASHTHGGPGGWGEHPLEMLVAGAYDPAYFETLAGQLARVIRQSRAGLEPAELGFVQVQAPGRQRNRVDPSMPTHDALSGLVFRAPGSSSSTTPIAVLAVFGAHATISHPVPPRLGGDYPAAMVAELKRITGARSVLFASGAVGDASPERPKARSGRRSAEALGKALAGDLAAALPSIRFDPEPEVANLRLEVDLPPVRLPFFSSWLRFSPALTWWIADRRTHLHAIRLGPAVLVGFPGDYSGHLATALAGYTRESGLSSVATSFDGDFRGYLVSGDVFRRKSCYETRWMNFYGPGLGDTFNDLARRMFDRLAGNSPPPALASPDLGELGPRFGLATLLVTSLVVVRRRPDLAGLLRRSGRLTVGVALAASLAFVIDPGLVDWAEVGIPRWLQLAGLPVGGWAIVRAGRRGSGETALLLGAGCALLSSSWLVVLMVLRGWVVAGLSDDLVSMEPRTRAVESREAADHQS
ncbi:neutral/alkaline non-lysosomal ceramidase N-terminal domain-containing protein (plasmid) [Tundrisphaera lichenicola]|uniref:neutral/alkaline non-lysosomal ceramidase N-terminal domain-containing protein n=1 Tax=Tundrisphaera lichenicola TaxID=2029860 RepID=UPI003EB87D5C